MVVFSVRTRLLKVATLVLEADLTIANRSANATVELGLALSTSSPTLDPSSSSPFFLIVTARILTTPHPDASITLPTHLNALGGLGNRSFNSIVCVSPETAGQKRIEIWPRGWPQYNWDPDDLRDAWDVMTGAANGRLEIRHPVDGTKIAEAQLKAGERYQASLTDKCLGTSWWAFGSLEEFEGVRFRQWREGEVEERADDEGADEEVRYLMGEFPDNLALVIEKGTAEFEIGETVG